MSIARKYTENHLLEIAKQYTSRNKFKIGAPKEYAAAHNYGVIDYVTKHMQAIHPRVCSKCAKRLQLQDFVVNKSCIEGHTQICKTCNNTAQNTRAKNNPNTSINRLKASNKAKAITRSKLLAYHDNELICVDCNYTSTIPDVFDYHHINPDEKLYEISSILDYKWETVKNEVDKCVLLCANCHRIRHYKIKENNA